MDKTVYEFILRLERESRGKRGYVQAKVIECLRAFAMLSDRAGTTEPMEVVLRCVEGLTQRTPDEPAKDTAPKQSKLSGFANMDENSWMV